MEQAMRLCGADWFRSQLVRIKELARGADRARIISLVCSDWELNLGIARLSIADQLKLHEEIVSWIGGNEN